jgi:hypothetical protein
MLANFLFKKTSNLGLKTLVSSLHASMITILQTLEPSSFYFGTFFQIVKPSSLV